MSTVAEFKTRFFRDLDAIQNAEDRAAKKALSRFGAFVRRRARSSMRRRKKASQPGQPPSAHVGHIKKFLFFAYESDTKTVVVGPALLNGSKRRSDSTVPELHEKGGSQAVEETQVRGGDWVRSGLVKIDGRPIRTRQAQYPERPFMKPAFDAELPQAAPMFKDMIS